MGAYLYRLGRPDTPLQPLQSVTGEHLRTARDAFYAARKQGGRVHVVGYLDLDAPIGSRKTLESFLRQTNSLDIPIVFHTVSWHATPKEREYALRELQHYLKNEQRSEGVHLAYDQHTHHALHQEIHPHDVVLIANHDLHGLDRLEDTLDREGIMVVSLTEPHSPAPRLVDSLSKNGYVLSATNRRSYEHAYAGALSHPYYESYVSRKPAELLGMLVSPHFGLQVVPQHVFVALDADRDPEFELVLRSFLQQQRNQDRTLVVCVVDPTGIDTSHILSTESLASDRSLYHHVDSLLR
jgi:hypothetical protein